MIKTDTMALFNWRDIESKNIKLMYFVLRPNSVS